MAILKKTTKLLIRETILISYSYRIFYQLRNTKSTCPKKLGATVEQKITIFVFNIAYQNKKGLKPILYKLFNLQKRVLIAQEHPQMTPICMVLSNV